LIGGVLVERTVAEVMPAVEKNREGLMQVIAKITEQSDAKKAKLDDLQVRYKIRVKGEVRGNPTQPYSHASRHPHPH
jgi:prefoldin subunit 2